jgi:DNA-binding XRE family transcriptional regulator
MIEARMKIDKLKFGKFVASRRKALTDALTQDMLAKKLHVGTSAIGKIEAGETLPSFELFIDLAEALQMTPGDLMMVLAEKEPPGRRYLEMNDWLYDKLINLVTEYEGIITPGAAGESKLTPEQAEARGKRRATDLKGGTEAVKAKLAAKKKVNPELESEADPASPNPTENSPL